ncbi:MFS transporter [Echinimonas agarilytica]|uniref:MFS transporter n=1 Tax=Echinimonas agarilytica TaxID=1215918 RepID=A0AA42B6F1_9GAMM|nr:MFS transporter [Echinimonas agarilytica]
MNSLLGAAIGGMVIVLNLGLGMNPALVGLVSALPRLTDAITDPLVGYISDQTRSRWGRRRPYIFGGAILTGIIFALLWQLPHGQSEDFYFWFFLVGSLVFYFAYTLFATPWVALGYELTPDYHERTRLMAVQNFMGQMAYLVSPWFLWFMQNDGLFDNMVDGAAWLAMIIGAFTIFVGVLPAIFLKEPYLNTIRSDAQDTDTQSFNGGVRGFFEGFLLTIKFKPFLCLCAATFLVFNGFMLVASFQTYVIIYYVFGGDQSLGAEYAGWAGTVSAIATFCIIVVISKISISMGKRKAFFLATGMSVFGYGLKWFCYHPEYPLLLLLPVPFYACGIGSLFTLMGSMIADVCDLDEIETNERREGMFGSIFWWVVKLGMAIALAAGGFLLNATGFDVELGSAQSDDTLFWMRLIDVLVPMVCSTLAIWMIYHYPITEDIAHQVRLKLERRRGKMGIAESSSQT